MKIDNLESLEVDGEGLKVEVILPYFNESLGERLMQECLNELDRSGVRHVKITRVFGALELPYAAMKSDCDVVIALAIVIRGETTHFDLVLEHAHSGLMDVQLKSGRPVIFGLLGCENVEQVEERIMKGRDFAKAAILQSKL